MKTPKAFDAVLELVETHQILSWVGLVAAALSGGLSLYQQNQLWAWLLLAVSVLVGILIGWALRRRRHPIEFLSCVEEVTLIGNRGKDAQSVSRVRVVFKRPQDTFTFGIRRVDGDVENERFFYRYLGRHGKNDQATQLEFGPGETTHGPSVVEGRHLFIRLPTPAKTNDQYEISRTYDARNCFEKDTEEVGKFIIHPCKSLKFKIIFRDCEPTNVLRYVSKDYIPVPGSHAALQRHDVGTGVFEIKWDIQNAEPGERYTIQWTWTGSHPNQGGKS